MWQLEGKHVMRGSAFTWLAATLLATATVVGAEFDPWFSGLGDLPGGGFESRATALSGDGSTVIGTSRSAASGRDRETFRWTRETGMVALTNPAYGETTYNYPGDVSYDGTVIVGGRLDEQAFRWTPEKGIVKLGTLFGGAYGSNAVAVSDDGSLTVGESGWFDGGQVAFTWTEENGMGFLPGGTTNNFIPKAMTGDGAVIVGTDGGYDRLLRWTADNGVEELQALHKRNNWAYGVSNDGSVIVGTSRNEHYDYDAFYWTEKGGPMAIEMPDGASDGCALGVSGDGSVVVGYFFYSSASKDRPFIWDAVRGPRLLQEILENDFGLDLSGWTLERAVGISTDGMTIAGYGQDPDGYRQAWIAVIPEPVTLHLFLLFAVCLIRGRVTA